MSAGRFYGKYRGTVINNLDPMQMGRIQAMVPDVAGLLPSSWAMPCVPVAGINMGVFTVPPIGAGVWIEFEKGDPDYPIWVGGFWGSMADPPVMAQAGVPAMPNIVMQSIGQNTITIFGAPTAGIALSCGPPTPPNAFIAINPASIVLNVGTANITMLAATGQIFFNRNALTILP